MIAIFSHDAGGAEVPSSWLAIQPEEYLLVLDRPGVCCEQLGSFEGDREVNENCGSARRIKLQESGRNQSDCGSGRRR